MFRRIQQPGRMGLSDSTDVNDLGVIVGGQRLEHRLYYFALACCGFEHVEIVLGGENYPALASGLESALRLLCGAPREHRSDSLLEAFSAFSFNLDGKEMAKFTKRCADRRNDLSHRGGTRESSTYRDFLADITRLSPALDYLYHAKMRQLIEVPNDELSWKASSLIPFRKRWRLLV